MQDNVARKSEGGFSYNPFLRMALEHLKAAGVSEPEVELRKIYKDLQPPKEAYDAEVEQFRDSFQEVMEMAEYLSIVEKRAEGDAVEYARLYDQGATREGRLKEGGDAYAAALDTIPSFEPSSFQEYLARFDDFPEHIHKQAYERAYRRAVQALK